MAVSRSGRYLLLMLMALIATLCVGTAGAQPATQREPQAKAAAIKAEAATADLQARRLQALVGRSCTGHQDRHCRVNRRRLVRAEARATRLHKMLRQPSIYIPGNKTSAGFAGSQSPAGLPSSKSSAGSSTSAGGDAPTSTDPAPTSSPATPTGEAQPPALEELQPRAPGSVILGLVGASGWGPVIAEKVIAAGFKSERFEADNEWMPDEDKVSYENGFRNDQVTVGNTPDETKLSAINIASWTAKTLEEVKEAATYDYTLLEVGNEMYLKGGQAEPVKYAEMYMSLANAVDAAGIKGVTLIFDSFGDYRKASDEMSEESNQSGWLGDALKAQPALKERVNAFSAHPYGIPGVKYDGHDWAIEGLEQEHAYAVALGFEHTDYYATEYGEEDQSPQVAASAQLQAERIKWTYTELLSQPYVKGIWYYQLHDDGTGHWGLVSGSWEPRSALGVMEGFLHSNAL